jgi:hypothetical protein
MDDGNLESAMDQGGDEARTHDGDFSFLDGYDARGCRYRSRQRGARGRPSRLQPDV